MLLSIANTGGDEDVLEVDAKPLVLSPLTSDSFADILARRLLQQCYPLQENIMLMLTNEQRRYILQISSGVWFIGLFNGIGYTETQSKMIIGGSDLSVRVDINVEGCPGSPNSRMWGQYCKQTVLPISCAKPAVYMNNQTAEKVTTCRNSLEPSSMGCRAPGGYSLDVTAIVEKLKIIAVDVRLKKRFSVYLAENFSGILYARYGAMPSSSLYDYSVHIRKIPLVIQSPKIGTWYFSLLPGNQTKGQGVLGDKDIFADLCYSLVWQKIECPVGKTGPHCAWESYMLKPAVGESSSESYDPSIGQKLLLEPFLSNSSLGDKLGFAWTYFLIDLPHVIAPVAQIMEALIAALKFYHKYRMVNFTKLMCLRVPARTILKSIALIASNGAAILPAFWTFKQKAFTQSVLFTFSGISSGLYHSCDSGTGCAVSLSALQFLDFWLSFMAVVSTFVYLTPIVEVWKEAILITAAIITAFLAKIGPTRPSNIVFVIAFGTLVFVIGLLKSSSTTTSDSFSTRLKNVLKTLRNGFCWGYILLGFAVLFLAGLSWELEAAETYWIWHSVWHVTIYTSSFFFQYSKITPVNVSSQGGQHVVLQDSSPT
ncbi:hypothetical protein IFM89_023341 [Coptis chinensis]|uniref:Uncharacterized protein n=1 Tax=Coptis chinensis TaxID=261450 RepID=A0A835LNR9_9MAGN|nr:hypothetical protein IFM89_023341 [Coptis chinensis]